MLTLLDLIIYILVNGFSHDLLLLYQQIVITGTGFWAALMDQKVLIPLIL